VSSPVKIERDFEFCSSFYGFLAFQISCHDRSNNYTAKRVTVHDNFDLHQISKTAMGFRLKMAGQKAQFQEP
jgi:hypothetical protein